MPSEDSLATARLGPESTVLVTGGAGFIGSHLVEALVDRVARVIVLDDLSTGNRANFDGDWAEDRIELVVGSTIDEGLVERLVADADVVFHLASAVGVQLVVSNPLDSLLKNTRGTDNVMSAVARHGKHLLFTSTSEVYGKNSSGALNEESDRVLGSPFKARWCYETSKAFGECLAHSYHREQGAAMTVVRLFNTVGPRQTGRYGMVVPTFVRQALEGRPITVYGDGSQTRCFAHVYDTVRGILQLMDTLESVGGVFNIGSTTEIPIVELARRVIDHTESESEINFVPYDEAYDQGFEELGRRKPDTSALRELTGWTAELTVDDAIRDVVAFERARGGGSAVAA
jgi:UDP-glucose 4-epimerase